jgi:hypothetical protein
MNTLLVAFCALCGVVGGMFVFCEYAGAFSFSPWVFRIGLCIWRDRRRLPTPTKAAFETSRAKFELVGPGVCLFRPKMEGSRSLIKGILRWEGDQATVEVRLLVFPLLVACGALLASAISWTTGAQKSLPSVPFLVGGLLFAGVYLARIPSEIGVAKEILGEYEALVTSPPSTDAKRIDEFGQIHRADDSRKPDVPV